MVARLSSIEGRLPLPPPSGTPPSPPIYGMPGYGGLPSAPPSTSTIIHTSQTTRSLPIQSIPFPHSPSPIPAHASSPNHHIHHDEDEEGSAIPRYYKLSFPMYDGKDDPLGWLNRCEHFFRAQQTREADKVWLASFHMTGPTQHWFYMLERDAGEIPWHTFKPYCQHRFGPAITINHLADLARFPSRSSVSEYQDAFLSKMAHAGYLSQEQQVQLFTGGLPDAIRVDVELQAPQDLQRAMALARAYERRSSAMVAAAGGGRPPQPPTRFNHHPSAASTTPHAASQ
jgi:hypothetical protein